MNYRKDIEKCIEYVELNIKEKLSPKVISSYAGYSVYHFCRVFNKIQNVSLMEYIRKRRLSLARNELLTDRYIIDIALDYQFESASGFSKAFKKEYGYSPSLYKIKMKGLNYKSDPVCIDDLLINPKIVTLESFKVAGYGIKTDINGSYTKDVAAYWNYYNGNCLESRMYKILEPDKHAEIGMCFPSKDDDFVEYVMGLTVNDYSKATKEMVRVEIPEAKYAVFTTMPCDTSNNTVEENNNFQSAIQQTWNYIFEEWFPKSDYEYDDDKHDFEYYDERCHFRTDTVMDIYVPVKDKIR